MKRIIQKLKDFFIRVWYAIQDKPNPKYKIEAKDLTKEEAFYKFLEENKDRIMFLMQHPSNKNNFLDVETLINNKKSMNESKEWYSKLVGYNKPDEHLKKIIDADLKLDKSEMDKIFYELQEKDKS